MDKTNPTETIKCIPTALFLAAEFFDRQKMQRTISSARRRSHRMKYSLWGLTGDMGYEETFIAS